MGTVVDMPLTELSHTGFAESVSYQGYDFTEDRTKVIPTKSAVFLDFLIDFLKVGARAAVLMIGTGAMLPSQYDLPGQNEVILSAAQLQRLSSFPLKFSRVAFS